MNTRGEYVDGELRRFEGWNLVDFREAPETNAEILIDLSPVYDMRLPEGFRIVYTDRGPHLGSWSVTGVEEAFLTRLRTTREAAGLG